MNANRFGLDRSSTLESSTPARSAEVKDRQENPRHRGFLSSGDAELNARIDQLAAIMREADRDLVEAVAHLVVGGVFEDTDQECEALAIIENHWGRTLEKHNLSAARSLVEYLSWLSELRQANAVQ